MWFSGPTIIYLARLKRLRTGGRRSAGSQEASIKGEDVSGGHPPAGGGQDQEHPQEES